MCNLKKLNISSNDITELVIPSHSNLEDLNLKYNAITKLVKDNATTTFSKLKYLNLSFNGIGDENLQSVLTLQFSNLKKLSLAHNRLSPEGCEIIANSTLVKIEKFKFEFQPCKR